MLTFFFGGALLEATVGSRFIFFYSNRYQEVGWWTFLLLLPVFGTLVHKVKGVKEQLKRSYPTRAVRWTFMFPLVVVVASGLVVIAPLGWIAGHAWAFGVDTKPIPGRLVSVEDYRGYGKGCDQKGKLAVREVIGSICLEKIATLPMKPDPSVIVSARQSALGLLVLGIEAQRVPR